MIPVFRGKSTERDNWIEGDVHFGPNNITAHIHPTKGSNFSIKVHVESVGQLVVWSYRNIKLFSGDIVEYHDTEGRNYKHEVRYDERIGGWCFGNMPLKTIVDSGYFQSMDLRVIGNVTDNPKLREECNA